MFLEGQIIEFLDADQLKPGYVRKQERDRLHVIDPRGRNLSMTGDRVAVVHGASNEADFPAIARAILERVEQRRTEVDVELLWEAVGGTPREFRSSELAELFFGKSSPENESAVIRTLLGDSLFFKRDGVRFLPKSAAQVSSEQTKRTRQREREDARSVMHERLTALLRDGTVPDAQPLLDRLHNWLRNRNNDEVGSALEAITGSGRARDAAYDILVRAGRLSKDRDRFLVTAGIEESFPPAVLEAAANLAPAAHDFPRVDYRGQTAITIDDRDTLEIDDALSIRRENDEWVVAVHIADVSAFVRKGDALDLEAARRCSTIYLPNVAVRMLPEALSIDLCSLRTNVERPAFTVEVRFDPAFSRLSYRIVLSTLVVTQRLTYEEADARIQADDACLAPLHRLAMVLQQQRASSGAITMRRPEVKVHVHGDTIEFTSLDPNSPARVVVSEMMILANGISADFASMNSLPVIFRTQEPRDTLPAGDTPASDVIAFDRLRRTFKRSRLSLSPGLHSGLGLTAYTQASSPIRRYADLVTQRQFTSFLRGEPLMHSRDELLTILGSAEAAELEIRGIEDRSTTYWLMEYLSRERMGQTMTAVALDKKGMAELQEVYLRGRLVDPGGAAPGDVLQVMIERVDAIRGDLRLKRV